LIRVLADYDFRIDTVYSPAKLEYGQWCELRAAERRVDGKLYLAAIVYRKVNGEVLNNYEMILNLICMLYSYTEMNYATGGVSAREHIAHMMERQEPWALDHSKGYGQGFKSQVARIYCIPYTTVNLNPQMRAHLIDRKEMLLTKQGWTNHPIRVMFTMGRNVNPSTPFIELSLGGSDFLWAGAWARRVASHMSPTDTQRIEMFVDQGMYVIVEIQNSIYQGQQETNYALFASVNRLCGALGKKYQRGLRLRGVTDIKVLKKEHSLAITDGKCEKVNIGFADLNYHFMEARIHNGDLESRMINNVQRESLTETMRLIKLERDAKSERAQREGEVAHRIAQFNMLAIRGVALGDRETLRGIKRSLTE